MKFLGQIVFLVFLVSFSNALEFKDCGSAKGSFTRIDISNCDTTKKYCILKRNTNASMEIDFTTTEDSVSELTAVVHGTVLGLDVPFPLDQPNACIDSGIQCPIKKGTLYKYTTTLPVHKSYPRVAVSIKWELKDANGDDVVCVKIPAKIE